jgi:fructose-bisphosphate aldolase class I
MNNEQLQQMHTGRGFIAALDQSGGSTPKALLAYGVTEDEYDNDDAMFTKIHEMRTRIITAPSFNGQKVIGAILFENTMDRDIDGIPTAQYLWQERNVVPFLKIDKGLEDEADGVQLMKPMPELNALLTRAKAAGIFGTKMRSFVKLADAKGIAAIVAQQFEVSKQILAHGLVPIIEPEVDINSPEKEKAEELLQTEILTQLTLLADNQKVILKLTIPTTPNFYAELAHHPKVIRVVALSGGYSRDDANAQLAQNHDMIASFSRALLEGLNAQQTDEEFNATLAASIDSIYQASVS